MHIAILTGGISTEREVALSSGTNMQDWCKKSGHSTELFDFPADISRFLTRLQASKLAIYFPTKNLVKNQEKHPNFDLVIPVFHGIYGEDGQVTAFLATLGCHYAYSDFDVHALCINKYLSQSIVETIWVKTPSTILVGKGEIFDIGSVSYPRFIKPNKWGSSIANFLVKNPTDCTHALANIQDDDVLIQELIPGREFTVWVYRDDTGIHVLPIIEIVTISGEFFDYVEKYKSDGSNEVFADLPTVLKNSLESESTKIYDHLDCRGVVRMDYRYDSTDIYFLEVNTIPGFTSGSLVPKMWKKAGKSEVEFVEMLNF